VAEGKRVKKTVRRRKNIYRSRRFLFGVGGTLIFVLVLVNLYFILGHSPRRQKYKVLTDGFKAFELEDYEGARLLFRRYVELDPDRANVWYMLGLACMHLGDDDEGVKALREAIRIRRKFSYAHTALSEHYRRRGELLKSLREAELAASSDPAPEDAFVALGEARMALGDMEGAIDAFRRAVQVNSELVETVLKLADLYFTREHLGLEDVNAGLARQRYEQARFSAQKLLTEDADNTRARVWRAKAQAGLGNLGEALEDLVRVVRADPGNADHRLLLARFQNAMQSYEDEVATLREALELTPVPEIPIRLARALTERLYDPEAGRQALLTGIEQFPKEPSLRIALVAHLRRREDMAGARETLDQALALFPDHSLVRETAGDLFLATGDPAAADSYRAAVRMLRENLSARRKLIGILIEDYLKAVNSGEDVGDLRAELDGHLTFFLDPENGVNPSDLLARSWQARLYFADGEFDKVAQLLGRTGGALPQSYEGLKILGLASMQSGDQRAAADAFSAALAHPSCPHAFDDYNLAYTTAFRTGRVGRETEIVRQALGRWPKDVDWRLRLATSLYRQRKYADAVSECDTAKTLLVGQRDVRPHLLAARILRVAGDITRARNELEEAVLIRRDAETRGALYAFMAATGDEKLGEEGFLALIEENPSDPRVYLGFGDFLMSRVGRGEANPERDDELKREALRHYEQALEINPDSREALRRVAEIRISQASSEEEAVAAAEETVRRIAEGDAEDPYVLYFTGKLQLLKGENEEALSALSRFVQLNPNDPAGYYYLAIAYRRADNLDKARDNFLSALGMDPAMAEAKLQLAALYFDQGIKAKWEGDLTGARASFEKVMSFDSNEPETRRFMAETLAGLGLLDEAGPHAEAVLAEKPDDPGALFLSGLSKAHARDLDGAERRFNQLVAAVPENPRSHLYLGMVLTEQGKFTAARSALRRAYELEPDGDEVLRAITMTESAAGRLPQAVAFVEAQRERSPGRAYVHQILGDLYLFSKRKGDAIESYSRAFDLDPTKPVPLIMAAVTMAKDGRIEEAIETIRARVGEAGHPELLFLIEGRLLQAQDRTDEAEMAFRESLRRDASLPDSYAELGKLLVTLGREEEGRRMLDEAVKRGVQDAAAFFHLARIAEDDGRDAEAIDFYRKVIRMAPGNAAALNNLAVLLAMKPETIEEAVEMATRARGIHPGQPAIADTLGWILVQADRAKEAVPLLVEAASALPRDAEVQHHAGMACYRNYEWEKAEKYLRNALRLDPEFPGAEEAREVLLKIR
jgi:tetratricopeptide (TPR) repeat protein